MTLSNIYSVVDRKIHAKMHIVFAKIHYGPFAGNTGPNFARKSPEITVVHFPKITIPAANSGENNFPIPESR